MNRKHLAVLAIAGTLALGACSSESATETSAGASTSLTMDPEQLLSEMTTTDVPDGQNFDSVDELLAEFGVDCKDRGEYVESDLLIFKETSTCVTNAGFSGIEIYHDKYSRSAAARAFDESQFAESKLDEDDPARITDAGKQWPFIQEGNWIVRCWDEQACEPWVKAIGKEPELTRSS